MPFSHAAASRACGLHHTTVTTPSKSKSKSKPRPSWAPKVRAPSLPASQLAPRDRRRLAWLPVPSLVHCARQRSRQAIAPTSARALTLPSTPSLVVVVAAVGVAAARSRCWMDGWVGAWRTLRSSINPRQTVQHGGNWLLLHYEEKPHKSVRGQTLPHRAFKWNTD